MVNKWPKQSECLKYYGDPVGDHGLLNKAWYNANITSVLPPFKMHMGDIPITRIPIHRLCSVSLARVLTCLMARYDNSQVALEKAGVTCYSGSFAFRTMRGLNHLSMHAYGCAIDFNAPDNPLGSSHGLFTASSPIVDEFKKEGWVWGGDWKGRPDLMHFQAAIVD